MAIVEDFASDFTYKLVICGVEPCLHFHPPDSMVRCIPGNGTFWFGAVAWKGKFVQWGHWCIRILGFFSFPKSCDPFSTWCFQIFFIFTPILGEMIQFDYCFSNGLNPPTSFSFWVFVYHACDQRLETLRRLCLPPFWSFFFWFFTFLGWSLLQWWEHDYIQDLFWSLELFFP